MKVTIEFGEEIAPVIQEHLDGETSVQTYVRAAVRYFNRIRQETKDGKKKAGVGDASRFGAYNTTIDPGAFLRGEE